MAVRRRTWTRRFEPSSSSVSDARKLADDVPVQCREAARVVVSELASNAVRHAGTPYDVTVRVDERVWIGVRDAGQGQPRLRQAPRDDPHGRGLFLVSSLAERWGVDWREQGGGKVVWAELPADDRADLADAC